MALRSRNNDQPFHNPSYILKMVNPQTSPSALLVTEVSSMVSGLDTPSLQWPRTCSHRRRGGERNNQQ